MFYMAYRRPTVELNISPYCDLRGWIKGTARTLYPVKYVRVQYGQYCPDNIGHIEC